MREILTQPVGMPKLPRGGKGDGEEPGIAGLAGPEPETDFLGSRVEPAPPSGPAGYEQGTPQADADAPPVERWGAAEQPGAPEHWGAAEQPGATEHWGAAEQPDVDEQPGADEPETATYDAASAASPRVGSARRGRQTTFRRPAARRPAIPRGRPARPARSAPVTPLRERLQGGVEIGGQQVSAPLLLLLGLAVVLLVVWLVALRPSSNSSSPTPPPPAALVPQTNAATSASTSTTATGGSSTSVTTVTTTAGTSTHPATAVSPHPTRITHPKGPTRGTPGASDLNGRIISALDARKVVALLVINPGSSDDEAVRAELDGAPFPAAQVLKAVVTSNDLSKLPVITASLTINQTPTFIVIDRHRVITTVVGFTDSFELDTRIAQAVA